MKRRSADGLCTDRITGIRQAGKRKRDVLTWEELRTYGITFYKEHGIDFADLNDKVRNELG